MQSFPKQYRPAWIFTCIGVLAALLSLIGSNVLFLSQGTTFFLNVALAIVITVAALWCVIYGIQLAKATDNRPAAINIVIGAFGLYGALNFLFTLFRS